MNVQILRTLLIITISSFVRGKKIFSSSYKCVSPFLVIHGQERANCSWKLHFSVSKEIIRLGSSSVGITDRLCHLSSHLSCVRRNAFKWSLSCNCQWRSVMKWAVLKAVRLWMQSAISWNDYKTSIDCLILIHHHPTSLSFPCLAPMNMQYAATILESSSQDPDIRVE